MKALALMALVAGIASGGLAVADTAAQSPKAGAAKSLKPMEMTCEEFLSLDEVTRPQVVYWSEGFDRKGKPTEAVFDVAKTASLLPVVVESCRQSPKSSYWSKFKAEWEKIF